MKKQQAIYYSARIIQRILLCLTVAAAAIHWMLLISIAVTTNYVGNLENRRLIDSSEMSKTVSKAIDMQTIVFFRWAVITLAITFLLLLITRFKTQEKRLIVDSAVVVVFCAVSVLLSQEIVRAFLSNLG